jgi:hypothetical protein
MKKCVIDKTKPTTTKHNQDPNQEPNNKRTHVVYATIKTTCKIYTDQTGQFPVTSSGGNQYVMVLSEYGTNAILTKPLKNQTVGKIL